MTSLFHDLHQDAERFWIEIDDLDWSLLSQFDQSYQTSKAGAGTDPDSIQPEQFRPLLSVFKQTVEPLSRSLLMPHLFLLLTADAQILDYEGTSSILKNLHELGIGQGTSLDVGHAGINAASLCKQTKKLSVVKGKEHTLDKFSNCYCLCAPVFNQGKVAGMLDLTFDLSHQTNFAIPLLVQAIQRMEQQLKPDKVEPQKIYSEFDQYNLTPREKQIGYDWLENKTVQDISAKYKISELTVRTFIKRIYYKVDVCSKGDFIRRFYLNA